MIYDSLSVVSELTFGWMFAEQGAIRAL